MQKPTLWSFTDKPVTANLIGIQKRQHIKET